MSELLEKILFLQKVDIFQNLSIEELHRIAQITETEHYDDEEYIFRQGDPGNYAYLIVSGKVELFFESGDGGSQVIMTFGEGSCFGEMALLDGQPRSAGARTVSECLISKIGRNDFIQLLHRYPPMALGIIAQLSLRLRTSNKKMNRLTKVVESFASLYEEGRKTLGEEA